MPKAVSEISAGNQFSRSSDQGSLADSATRTFRVILNSPDEVFDIQSTCGVFIGNAHPTNTNIACNSFDAKYEGDTRMVLVATFNYGSEASAQTSSGGGGGQAGGPKTISPEYRPASWSISTEVTEKPVRKWTRRTDEFEWGGDLIHFNGVRESEPVPPRLPPFGENIPEGLTRLLPVTTIKFMQFVLGGYDDPTRHCEHVGKINNEEIRVGSLEIKPHQLMLRSINATPVVEPWGGLVRRGWNAEYTFLYNPEKIEVDYTDVGETGEDSNIIETQIGWDVAIILEGRSVLCYDPSVEEDNLDVRDPYGVPLKKGDDGAILDTNNLALADGLFNLNSVARAHVKVGANGERGITQAVANEPVALNPDGAPRYLANTNDRPLVWAYQVYDDINMTATLQLRLD